MGDAPCHASDIGSMCWGDLERAVERRALRILESGEAAVRAAYDRLHAAGGSNAIPLGVAAGAVKGDVVCMAHVAHGVVKEGPNAEAAEAAEASEQLQEVTTAMASGVGGSR